MKIYQVDAFSERPFAGNSAAVCMVAQDIDAALMQHIAMEMNLSETAFLQEQDAGYNLRWFTPAFEVDLCGHATLASAHVLWETGALHVKETASFHTRSGLLKAKYSKDGIELDFPAQPAKQVAVPQALIESLGVEPVYSGYNGSDYLIVVDDDKTVKTLTPDFRQMSEVTMRGVIVTARSSNKQFDFVSRFFAPAAGIDEDPVTGSAHCCLGPYWSQQLGKSDMHALQDSSRGGTLRVQVHGDRVLLTGKAVTVLEGELFIS